jgi:hypothetical protein
LPRMGGPDALLSSLAVVCAARDTTGLPGSVFANAYTVLCPCRTPTRSPLCFFCLQAAAFGVPVEHVVRCLVWLLRAC